MRELVKLRRRFILILMCSVGLVLTVALVVSVISSYTTQHARIQNSLIAAQAIEGGEELRPYIGGPGVETELLSSGTAGSGVDQGAIQKEKPHKGAYDMVPVYVVDIIEETGEIINYGNAAEMNEETLYAALERIQPNTDAEGFFADLGLYFVQRDLPQGEMRIAFADASQLYDTTLTQALVALAIWVGAMLAFFVLSRILSRMMLKPVEGAWDKQRQFIADASHELKTPLTIILANNNIVMSHPEKPTAEQQQWLESTEEEANRMNDLVTDLLLLAQVEHAEDIALSNDSESADEAASGETGDNSPDTSATAPYTSVDLSALVERSLLQFDAVFFERSISLNSTIEEGLCIKGNPEHLRRLIDILLDNASKYGNKGGEVLVKLVLKKDASDSVLLTVSNSGAYIPPEKIERIFDRFFRGDAAHSSTIEGSGLGLALAQEIVREHGGSITVTNVPLLTSKEKGESASGDDDLVSEETGAADEKSTDTDSEVTGNADEGLAQTTFSIVLPLLHL